MLNEKETHQNTSDPEPEPIEPTAPGIEDIDEADVSDSDIETKMEPNE